MKNRFKFTRQDKRQAKREGISLQEKFDFLIEEFESLLFQENCPDTIFDVFHLEWKQLAEKYNSSHNIVSIANPRAFYDYSKSHEERLYDPIIHDAPQYINTSLFSF